MRSTLLTPERSSSSLERRRRASSSASTRPCSRQRRRWRSSTFRSRLIGDHLDPDDANSTAVRIISAMRAGPGPEETHFTMPLPGGGSLSAHRRVTRLPGGLTWIEEEMKVRGRLSGAFATGPGWIFELHRVTEGAVSYVQDGERRPVDRARFGLLYAPFSITELQCSRT